MSLRGIKGGLWFVKLAIGRESEISFVMGLHAIAPERKVESKEYEVVVEKVLESVAKLSALVNEARC